MAATPARTGAISFMNVCTAKSGARRSSGRRGRHFYFIMLSTQSARICTAPSMEKAAMFIDMS